MVTHAWEAQQPKLNAVKQLYTCAFSYESASVTWRLIIVCSSLRHMRAEYTPPREPTRISRTLISELSYLGFTSRNYIYVN